MSEGPLPSVVQQSGKGACTAVLLAVGAACCSLRMPAAVLTLVLLLVALAPAAVCLFRWDEPKFPLRRPIKETIDKIGEIMGHIEDDLKVSGAPPEGLYMICLCPWGCRRALAQSACAVGLVALTPALSCG
jgi:hypothetical protein